MERNDTFERKLTFGQQIENAVKRILKEKFPHYSVRMTDQTKGSSDRDNLCLVDVIVEKEGRPVLGIECKRSATKFYSCLDKNGWDGNNNTPLNKSSLEHYKQADFPFYIININQFCHTILVASIEQVLHSPHDPGIRKPWGEVIYNFDCTLWKHYYNTKLTEIIDNIITEIDYDNRNSYDYGDKCLDN